MARDYQDLEEQLVREDQQGPQEREDQEAKPDRPDSLDLPGNQERGENEVPEVCLEIKVSEDQLDNLVREVRNQ